ncbi:MAG: recombinase family protein [Finegoldia magna]|uniref:Recombinase family protein n=1 Tax=Finegoldia magna TaxID=1260 RepID=A0A943LE97_FINMA|nr:recombinase family protein [Finegoldia magna]MBS5965786.1 recombinase family protein [Finegoldia magna]
MNSKVIVIPAKKKKGNSIKESEKKKLRVAAYARVSTDSDEQATSYDTQVDHYTNYIKKNPDWEFAGVFSDEGISGTYTKKRAGFNKMIEEAMEGNIDYIITKSISRFARNTLDCLKYIRKLKENNIPVYFEKENINTMDAKGEVLITIMASLAQQESQSLSQNVKLGFQYRFQQGQVQVNHNRFLGYTKNEDGKLIIVPEEAKIIKRIYREYLEGASLRDIKEGLEKDKIVNGAGNKKWHVSNLNQILTNEKYMGDALLQKTYTVDFLNKKRVKNDGIAPQYYVENSHEAIIPKEIFMRVGEEMYRRANMASGKGKRRIYSSKYALSSIVYCSKCGDIYRRIAWNNRGKKYTVWRCCTRVTHGPDACEARTIREEDLQEVVVEAINQLITESNELKETIKENIEKAITGDGSSGIEEIDKEMLAVQEEHLKVANAKKDYTDLADRVEELRNEKDKILLNMAEEKNELSRLKELEEFLDNQELEIESYDEELVRKLVDKIVVYEEKLKVIFKSGLEVEIDKDKK